jgi:hypothetical protein
MTLVSINDEAAAHLQLLQVRGQAGLGGDVAVAGEAVEEEGDGAACRGGWLFVVRYSTQTQGYITTVASTEYTDTGMCRGRDTAAETPALPLTGLHERFMLLPVEPLAVPAIPQVITTAAAVAAAGACCGTVCVCLPIWICCRLPVWPSLQGFPHEAAFVPGQYKVPPGW